MSRHSRKHMANKVPDHHVHVHPLNLIKIFATEKKNIVKPLYFKVWQPPTLLLDLHVTFFLNTRTLYARTLTLANEETNK